MTTKPRAKKFRIRRGGSMGMSEGNAQPSEASDQAPDAPQAAQLASPAQVAGENSLDAVRREGLTGRQLRMARRVAQKNGLAVTSDFDAVLQLRAAGIDPFQRNTVLELVAPEGTTPKPEGDTTPIGRIQLPQTTPAPGANLPSTEQANPADRRAAEIMKIQRDIAKRRRRKGLLLLTRLAVFVLIPTFLVGWYFYNIATPMYATKSEFIIQQADSGGGAGGIGSLLGGTSMATQQDSITVQSYLASRAALARLDEDHDFKAHFSGENIDAIQRLPDEATNEAAFRVYQKQVKISYDPTEGILRMEVVASNPETSQLFSEALIGYAEEQVDQLTQRMREDQMSGARLIFESAQLRRNEALEVLSMIQADSEVLDPLGESGAFLQRVTNLEVQRDDALLALQSLLDNQRPNQARVNGARAEIARLDSAISSLRTQMVTDGSERGSLAQITADLRKADENYQTEVFMLQQALTQLEAAQIEANRQVRYLSLGVQPIAPDEATYPRSFENTILAFLIFAGVYLMISLTASILREQVTA